MGAARSRFAIYYMLLRDVPVDLGLVSRYTGASPMHCPRRQEAQTRSKSPERHPDLHVWHLVRGRWMAPESPRTSKIQFLLPV